MPTILLPIIPGTLPPNSCYPSDPQQLLLLFSANQNAQLDGATFYNYGNIKPDPAFNNYPWLRTVDMRWYFFSGSWLTPVNYDLNERRIYRGSPTDLITYDGGDNGTPSDRSGPMWEIDTDFNGRSPMGVGDIPGANPAKTLGLNELFGDASTILAALQLPENFTVTATLPGNRTNLESGTPQWLAPTGTGGTIPTTPATQDGTFQFTNTGGSQPINNVHPVVGCYIIKWTGRAYRRIS